MLTDDKTYITDSHFHSLSDKYEKNKINFDQVYDKLSLGIDTATKFSDSEKILAKIKERDNIFTTLGLGPWQTVDRENGGWRAELQELRNFLSKGNKNEKIVAFGEIGLDYHYNYPKEEQEELFIKQVELSLEYNLPIILHLRDCFSRIKDLISSELFKENLHKNIVHSFSFYEREEAKFFLDRGFYLSFSGLTVIDKNEGILRNFAYAPLDRILLETDSPYLLLNKKLHKVNTPLLTEELAEILCVEKNISCQALELQAFLNLQSFIKQEKWK